MKKEDTPQPPVTTFSAAQWGPNQIPIDPALQQQSQQPQVQPQIQAQSQPQVQSQAPQHTPTTYSHYQSYQHYPQASYNQYHQYVPPQAAQPTQTQPLTSVVRPQQQQTNTVDTNDIATLNDALGSAGVDLRAEEETLQRSYDPYQQSYRGYNEDRTRKQPTFPNFDTRFLGATMRSISTQQKVPKVPEDTVNYLALALRTRLQELITAMIAASAHRTDTQFDRPASLYEDGNAMWSLAVRADVSKQLAAIERVEREEEMRVRRERKERAEAAAAQHATLQAQANAADGSFDEDGQPKKKKKKEGPGVTARNMSEDVRKKMSNAVASQAAGLGTGKYAWMTAVAASAPPKVKAATPAPGAGASGVTTPATTMAPAASTTTGRSWARPYVPTKPTAQQTQAREDDPRHAVTLRDAMFVIETERGHGGGRGSATGWT